MIVYYIMRGDGAAAKKKGWLIMKQVFKIQFHVPNLKIKKKVFDYLIFHKISFNYETCGDHIGGYMFKVWNVTEITKEMLFKDMREICGSDFRFSACFSLGFVM